ncbi:TetR family transcriptional regulator [Streptomyces sp. NPDC058466]|uniref:TetR/AcrR family transcriptional regulator n=1 Tax=Streptomyces sp. NPDC058466 TaxID=3346512 RepID=UPI003665B8FE
MDQIAEAAEISPSTFFRYFPTKEDVVVQDEYDPALARALRARPGLTRPPGRRTDRRRHPGFLRSHRSITVHPHVLEG